MQRHIGLIAALGLLAAGAMTAPCALAAGTSGATAPAPMGTMSPATGTTAQPAPTQAPAANKSAAAEAPHARPAWHHDVAVLQESLDSAGEHVRVDGVWGPQTTAALRDYQKANGLAVTGHLDQPTRAMLDPIG